MDNNEATSSSDTKEIRTREEVHAFLCKVKELLDDESSWEINNRPWKRNRTVGALKQTVNDRWKKNGYE